jgi:DNA-binding NarL/FixJ family response regulator
MKQEHPLTVAIVDDNAFIRESAKFRLSRMGYKIILEAEDGQVLLDKLAGTPPPDICLLDINMPVMDGFETTMRLKKDWPGIRILIFSMEDSSTCKDKSLELGAHGFVSKDADTDELREALLSVACQEELAGK